jgi:hypothetical protein
MPTPSFNPEVQVAMPMDPLFELKDLLRKNSNGVEDIDTFVPTAEQKKQALESLMSWAKRDYTVLTDPDAGVDEMPNFSMIAPMWGKGAESDAMLTELMTTTYLKAQSFADDTIFESPQDFEEKREAAERFVLILAHLAKESSEDIMGRIKDLSNGKASSGNIYREIMQLGDKGERIAMVEELALLAYMHIQDRAEETLKIRSN